MKIGRYKIYLKNHDLIALLIMYGWSTWYFFSSNKLGQHEQTMAFIAPMYYIMLALLVLYLLKTLVIEKVDGIETAEQTVAPTVKNRIQAFWVKYKRTFGFIILLSLYLFGMPRLGFILSTILYLALTTAWLGNRSKIQILLISVISSFVVFFLFEKFFMVHLPSGILF